MLISPQGLVTWLMFLMTAIGSLTNWMVSKAVTTSKATPVASRTAW
jgi:hypothetical protein